MITYLFHQNYHFGNVLRRHDDSLPKIEMVRTVQPFLLYVFESLGRKKGAMEEVKFWRGSKN